MRTAALIACAPEEPPVTIKTGRPSVKPNVDSPFSRLPFNISGRMGVPVYTPRSPKPRAASGNVHSILRANGALSLLASPGVMSDSWISSGTRLKRAP